MPDQILRNSFELIGCELRDNRICLHASDVSVLEDCQQGLYWRYVGEAGWRLSTSDELTVLEASSDEVRFDCVLGDVTVSLMLSECQETRRLQMSGTILHCGDRPIELARFCYLQGVLPEGLQFLELEGATEKPHLRKAGDIIQPYRETVEELWMSMGVQWPRLHDTVHDTPNWAVSKDVAAFIPDWHSKGWGFGFTGPGTAFGEIGYKTDTNPVEFYVGVLLDNIVLDPGETRVLENAIVWYGDWQDGLKKWANECADNAVVTGSHLALSGYCSWYQRYTGITSDDILRAAKEFSEWPVTPGGRTIQIDDGFQIAPGDWRPNERFESVWHELPAMIAETGSIPGIWLAPTMIHESHPVVGQHPEWVQTCEGKPAIYFSNWGKTYVLEPDHPEVQRFIEDILKQYVADGWKYFKVDFTYPVSTARVAFDRKKTSFETLRGMYRLMRSALGSDILLSACIGVPGRYALGYADFARLGGDIGSSWDAVKQTVRAWLIWSCTHRIWWQGDPDVFMMRTENSSLSYEESYLLTGTIGLFDGMFLTSDFPSQWSSEATQAVREIWGMHNTGVNRGYRISWDSDQNVRAYRVSYERDHVLYHLIGVYNWSENECDTGVSLEEVALCADQKWKLSGDGFCLSDGRLLVKDQPAHSLRIVCLHV